MLDRLQNPIPIHSLAFFRLGLGLILLVEVIVEWSIGHLHKAFVDTTFHFTYPGFDWVQPLPGWGMHLLQAVALLAAIGFFLGLFYRLSAGVFLLIYTYKFLLDQAWYLNHHYLIILVVFLMMLSPAGKYASLDVAIRGKRRLEQIPAAWLAIFVGMISLVYFYAGIAKLNYDWLRGEPMRTWLFSGHAHILSGDWMKAEWMVYLLSYGGLVLDLTVAWFLLWRPTRKWAFMALLVFHFGNFLLFEIGIFPWSMILASTLYFRPDWPRRFLEKLPVLGYSTGRELPHRPVSRAMLIFLGVFLGIQILLPLRHFAYPGVVHWNEEGHRFAWHMMLRSKRGSCFFTVKNLRTGETQSFSPVSRLHRRQYRKMAVHPDMILLFARYIDSEMEVQGWDSVAVYAQARAGLNGRKAIPFIDPAANLLEFSRGLKPYPFVLPIPGYGEPERLEEKK